MAKRAMQAEAEPQVDGELHGKAAVSLATVEAEETSLPEAMEALREAGGDAWDKIDDTAEFLGRKDDDAGDRVRDLEAKLAQYAEDDQRRRESIADVERLRIASEDASDRAKRAKKAYEAAVDAHFELEAELADPQPRLPFGTPIADDGGFIRDDLSNAVEVCNSPGSSDAKPDDSWRSVPLSKLGIPDELPPSLVEKLEEAGIRTMADLANYTASGKRLTNIPGVGQAKAEKIEQATADFWVVWNARPVDTNAELLEGVREAEAAKGGPDPAWRETPIDQLGLGADQVSELREDWDLATAGQLMESVFDDDGLTGVALDRLRQRLSNAQIADFDAFRAECRARRDEAGAEAPQDSFVSRDADETEEGGVA